MGKRFILGVLLVLGPLAARAQAQLSGRVLDRATHQPVPYASVVVAGTTQGTTSNAEGEFVLPVRQLPAKVLAFSLGYGRDSASVAQASSALTLSLAPAPIQLPGAEPASYAAQLLVRAYRQVQRTRQQPEYGQAFYRQITRNDGLPNEVLELVWDVRASSAGLEGTHLAQGRYAVRRSIPGKLQLFDMRNFSLFTKVLGGFCGIAAQDTARSHAVVCADPDQQFVLHYKGIVPSGPYRLAEVAYESRPGIPTVQGSVFIDLATAQVLHARATREVEISITKGQGSIQHGTVTMDADFKPGQYGALPSFVRLAAAATGTTLGQNHEIRIEAQTAFYDLGPVPTGLPYAGPDSPTSDLEAIQRKTYDPAYWQGNAVVKRTPLEEAVMRSFEDQKAFGTMLKK